MKSNLLFNSCQKVDDSNIKIDDFLMTIISNLERSDETLVVSDFDDTAFSRDQQFLEEPILLENRWYAWNEVILKKLWWYKEFVKKFYSKEWLTNEIVEVVKDNTSMILTAWDIKLQSLKVEAVWFNNIPTIVVQESNQKPLALLRAIISIWKIPKKIEIYDDRVEYLLTFAPYLSKILQTEISIYEVWLNWTKVDTFKEYNYN